MVKRRTGLVQLLAVLCAFPACNGYDSAAGPTDPSGNYVATRFLTTANGTTMDQLANGVTLSIRLNPDGSTAGSLDVPAAGTDPLDLTGTWSRRGDTVTFGQATDNFLDHLSFRVDSYRLRAAGTVGPTTFEVVLSR